MKGIFDFKRYLGTKRAMVLMYHRVNNLTVDPWQLTVSPHNFDEQLQVLKKKYKVISVQELVSQIKTGSFRANQVCITFDDGYLDNYENAKPILQKYHCPATFYIASKYVLQQQVYWWDRLQQIFLETTTLEQSFSVTINNEVLNYDLDDNGILTEEQVQKHKNWIWPDSPPTKRAAVYLSLWERMKPLSNDRIDSILTALEQICKVEMGGHAKNLPMNTVQLKHLAEEPLFKIGLHTDTHPDLSCHSIEVQRKEICKNKDTLEQLCGYSIDTISYPYGASNDDTILVVSDIGLRAAFTTKARPVTKKSSVYRLGRYQVLDMNGEAFEKELTRYFNPA